MELMNDFQIVIGQLDEVDYFITEGYIGAARTRLREAQSKLLMMFDEINKKERPAPPLRASRVSR